MPMSVRIMRNIDLVMFPLALLLFLAAGWPVLGWATAAGAWALQRGIDEFSRYKAERAEDVRSRVGFLAGSMILRGWVVAGMIVAVGIASDDNVVGLSAAVLFLAVFTLQLTLTMAMRPYDTPVPPAQKVTKKGPVR